MARYKLKGPHYLNVPGTEWEQVEVDLVTGRQGRHRYPVPRYLDPGDPADCVNGICVVTDKKSPEFPGDILFVGPPSMDMDPLDAEAEALVAKVKGMGEHPIESLPANGQMFSDVLLDKLTKQLDALASGNRPTASDARVSALEAQIAELKLMILGKTVPADELEPLPPPETEPAREPIKPAPMRGAK
jgi:hypothetical protein